jgi:hypothetical protein
VHVSVAREEFGRIIRVQVAQGVNYAVVDKNVAQALFIHPGGRYGSYEALFIQYMAR